MFGRFGPLRASLWDVVQNFSTSVHLSDRVNGNLAQSQIEGGVDLRQLPADTVLQVRTLHHSYTIVNKGLGWAWICGHPQYCPVPVLVYIKGSTWGGSMLKQSYIGRGMRLEFQREAERPVTTSAILDIVERAA